MRKENFRGITLIALVVTIVVLLILAAVSISMLTGENGIVKQAQDAKEETRAGNVQEERDLWIQEREIAKNTGEIPKSMEEILNELKEKGTLTEEEVEGILNDENNEIKIGSRVISFKVIEIQEPENINDWEWYVDSDGKIVLTAYKGKDTEVIVPNYIDGIPVKKIGTNTKHAWYNDEESIWSTEICENEAYYYTQKTITKIIIPEGIKEIADYAFFHGEAIKEIIMPETLDKIGINVFESCYSLISVKIPNSVTNIEENTFEDCSSLESIEIPNSITNIWRSAFSGCSSLTTINYTGTEEQWNAISIDLGNTDLTNATINYNYKSE